MSAAAVEKLKELVAGELDVNLDPAEIDENASLLEGEIDIDSICIVELISIIEEKFNIVFTNDELVPESFSTMAVPADLVPNKLQASPVYGEATAGES